MAKFFFLLFVIVILLSAGAFWWYSVRPQAQDPVSPGAGLSPGDSSQGTSNTGDHVAATTANQCPAIQESAWPALYFKFKNGDKVDRWKYESDTHSSQGELETRDIGFYRNELIQNGWKIYDIHADKPQDGFWGTRGKEWVKAPVWFSGSAGSLLAYNIEYGSSYFDPFKALLPLSDSAYPIIGAVGQDRNNVQMAYKNSKKVTNGQLKQDFQAACAASGGALQDAGGLQGAVPGTQARCVVASTNMAYVLYYLSERGDDRKVDTFTIYEKLICKSGN